MRKQIPFPCFSSMIQTNMDYGHLEFQIFALGHLFWHPLLATFLQAKCHTDASTPLAPSFHKRYWPYAPIGNPRAKARLEMQAASWR